MGGPKTIESGRTLFDETEKFPDRQTFIASWRERRRTHGYWGGPIRILPTLVAGSIAGFLTVIGAVSFAALIFSGQLAEYRAEGIGMLLVGAVVVGIVLTVFSTFPGTIAAPQDKPAAIFATVAALMVASLPAGTSSEVIFATVVCAIALVSILTGLLATLLGVFRLGNLMRFIPFPVVGGFFAGSGWLLIDGTFSVVVDQSLTIDHIESLFTVSALLRWVPTVVFAVVLLVLLRRTKSLLLFPLMIAGGVGLFYAILTLSGTTIEEAEATGWLLGPFPEGGLWHPISPNLIIQAEWGAILDHSAGLLSILPVSIISLLLYISGIEVAVERDIDINRELKATGVANILTGGTGGVVGFHTVSLTVLNGRMGAANRLVGFLGTGICVAVLFAGTEILSFMPKQVLGGLLFFIGLDFLVEWLYDGRHRLTRSEYAIVLLILIVVAAAGFLTGIAVGLIAGLILFIINFSQIGVVRLASTAAVIHSKVERTSEELELLRMDGESVRVLKLQGYIFFGTASRLLDQARQLIADQETPPMQILILDFKSVVGVDSSAVVTLQRLRQLAAKEGFSVIFTSLRLRLMAQLADCGFDFADNRHLGLFPTLDEALAWSEEQLLERARAYRHTLALDDALGIGDFLGSIPPELLGYMERITVERGTRIIEQGDDGDELFLVHSGQVTVMLEHGNGRKTRLKTLRAGTVVGESAIYLGKKRTASVIADTHAVLYRLTKRRLQALEIEQPAIASEFHRFMATLLSSRVTDAIREIDALLQ